MSYRYYLGAEEAPDPIFDAAALTATALREKMTGAPGPFKLVIAPTVPVSEVREFFGDAYVWPDCDDFWTVRVDGGPMLEHPTLDEVIAAMAKA